MSWRTLIISTRCKLDYKMGYMVIRGLETQRVYLDEIAILMIENPAVSLTGCLIEALTEKKIKVIFCDGRRSPMAELVPCHGSHNSSARIREQVIWPEDLKNAAWKAIVREKILNQAKLLENAGKEREMGMLRDYADCVEPGDTTNREGHAAKVYFNALFGMKFTRGADTPINAALNYGYSIILSTFNREVVSCGYITQLGIFHDNMFNHFNLSCDLMEPFRGIVDNYVYEHQPEVFGADEKHEIWKLMHEHIEINYREQTVLNAIKIYCIHFFDAMRKQDISEMVFPRIK